MSWFAPYAEILTRDRPLGPLTTLGVGGGARYFFEPRSVRELAELRVAIERAQVPCYYLGNGSNLIVDDAGVDGAVIGFRRLRSIRRLSCDRGIPPGNGADVEAGAGVLLPHLIRFATHCGLGGLERCVGIPGAVGGSVYQNAGGSDGSLGELLVSATVVSPEGETHDRPVADLGLGYRTSRLEGAAVAAVRIRLTPEGQRTIASRARDIMLRRKATQPLQDRTPGCIFRNPSGGRSAGRLLDEAGMKGFGRGRASISEKHANFVINRGGARSGDVRDLIREAHQRVLDRFGVSLVLEVVPWPRPGFEAESLLGEPQFGAGSVQ